MEKEKILECLSLIMFVLASLVFIIHKFFTCYLKIERKNGKRKSTFKAGLIGNMEDDSSSSSSSSSSGQSSPIRTDPDETDPLVV